MLDGYFTKVRPDGPPVLRTQSRAYNPRETLEANCTSRPSRPSAQISYTLNGRPVASELPRTRMVDRGLNVSIVSISIVLTERDFDEAVDRLNLTCVSAVPGLEPKEFASVIIERRTPHPRPERVTLPNTAFKSVSSWRLAVFTLSALHLFHPSIISTANIR